MRTAVSKQRFDEEGLDRIDIDASSHTTWKNWRHGISEKEMTALFIWRGDAVPTPTRRYLRNDGKHDGKTVWPRLPMHRGLCQTLLCRLYKVQ